MSDRPHSFFIILIQKKGGVIVNKNYKNPNKIEVITTYEKFLYNKVRIFEIEDSRSLW